VQDVAFSERKLSQGAPDSARVHTQTKFYQFLHQYQVRDRVPYAHCGHRGVVRCVCLCFVVFIFVTILDSTCESVCTFSGVTSQEDETAVYDDALRNNYQAGAFHNIAIQCPAWYVCDVLL
jgi:hypothetical protein